MIYLLRFPAVGGETGKASTRKVLALRLSPPRDNLSRSRFLGLGAPSSFSCPVIRQLYSAWRSHITERAARRDRRPTCPLADRGRGAANPFFGVGVVRSFPWRKSQRTHRLAPRIMLGAAHYSVMERKKTSFHIPPEKTSKWSPNYRFFLRYFFIDSIPRRTERRTTLLSVPSSRAISR